MRARSASPYQTRPLVVPQITGDSRAKGGHLVIGAYVDRYPPLQNAGAEWMLHTMLRWLVQQGHSVTVATSTDDPFEFEGVDVIPAADRGKLADVDVMIGHLLWTREVVQFCVDHNLPLVYLIHNTAQIDHWTLGQWNVTGLVWNSEWVEATCGPQWKGPGVVCRPPVDCGDYSNDSMVPAFEREMVTLINPNPEKGGGLFFEVAKRNAARRFLTVGGAYGTQLRRPSNARNVEQIPPTPNMAIDVYSRTRVLFVPSLHESWGRVAIEAMASGIPVVAHPTPGLVEALGSTGIFRDRGDVKSWSDALVMLDDVDRYHRWSIAAQRRADDLWAMSKLVDLPNFEQFLRLAADAREVRSMEAKAMYLSTHREPGARHAHRAMVDPDFVTALEAMPGARRSPAEPGVDMSKPGDHGIVGRLP